MARMFLALGYLPGKLSGLFDAQGAVPDVPVMPRTQRGKSG
jgi:hypothetical protein